MRGDFYLKLSKERGINKELTLVTAVNVMARVQLR